MGSDDEEEEEEEETEPMKKVMTKGKAKVIAEVVSTSLVKMR